MNKTMTPDEIEQQPFFHIPFWLAPVDDVFQRRSQRLRQLVQQIDNLDQHWAKYLQLLADVCLVQQDLLQQLSELAVPITIAKLPLSSDVIDHYTLQWPMLFDAMYHALVSKLTPTAQRVWQELLALSITAKIALLKRVLTHQHTLAEQDYVVWINALLHIVYTHVATILTTAQVQPIADIGFCPCCGQDAVGAVIIGKGELAGLRYLSCALCNSQWHMVRARCSFCDHDHDLNVHRIEAAPSTILADTEAECCPQCHGYRKRYQLEKQQYADPIADDLTTLTLDIVLSQENWQRGGFNPFLLTEKSTMHSIE